MNIPPGAPSVVAVAPKQYKSVMSPLVRHVCMDMLHLKPVMRQLTHVVFLVLNLFGGSYCVILTFKCVYCNVNLRWLFESNALFLKPILLKSKMYFDFNITHLKVFCICYNTSKIFHKP